MKIKRIITAVCFLCIMTFTGVPGASASTADTVSGSVTIGSSGVLNAEFCGGFTDNGTDYVVIPLNELVFSTASVSINQPTTSTASVFICFTDTKPTRGAFTASMQTSAFASGGDTIPASAVKPTKLNWTGAGRQGSGVGTIGVFDGSANRTDFQTDITWQGGDLSQSRIVAYGLSGGGTAAVVGGGHLYPGSVVRIDLQLTVPAGTQPGTYTSTFTLDITPSAP